MEKTLEFATGNVNLKSSWDCDLGELTDVYDPQLDGEYIGTIQKPIGDINEENFEELAMSANLDW